MHRTRIKICGITRTEDALAAVQLGADAIGLVFYPPSPRFVATDLAREIALALPPFVTIVGLFVNADRVQIESVLERVPVQVLQFHGEETAADCEAFDRCYIKAARVSQGLDLVEYGRSFSTAQGLLLDAVVEGYGGGGDTFDWSLIPSRLPLPIILAGGLHAGNVAQAIRVVRPWAVDVSTGVEVSKGVKDARKIAEFVSGVRNGDHGSAL